MTTDTDVLQQLLIVHEERTAIYEQRLACHKKLALININLMEQLCRYTAELERRLDIEPLKLETMMEPQRYVLEAILGPLPPPHGKSGSPQS